MKRRLLSILLTLIIIINIPFIPYNINHYKHYKNHLKISSPPITIPFRVGISYEPIDIDPHLAWDEGSYVIIDQVCEGLYTYNLSDPELKIIPHLASDYGTWNPSGSVIFTWQRMAWALNTTGTNFDEVTILKHLYTFLDGTPIVNATIKNSDYNITFILNGPYVPFEALLCFSGSYILSPNSMPATAYIETTTGDLVGTGPFVYDYYVPSTEINLHAFTNYWRGKAAIDKLIFSIIPDDNLLSESVLNETTHLISRSSRSVLSTYASHPALTVLNEGKTSIKANFFGMNTVLINRTFRKALSYAIDYSYINDVLNLQNTG
ncbi:MAG: ABC transporter substrate-binding protein, partial [Promethearchaeota archaeon]